MPAEANRRFQADLRATQERRSEERTAQLALHEEKKRFIAKWISEHGSDEQKARQSAGVLPMVEAIEALTDHVFAPLGERPQYRHDGAKRLTAHLGQFPATTGVVVAQADMRVDSEHAQMATAEQWALVQECRSLLPAANVTLRRHRISFARDPTVPPVVLFAVLVTLAHGPFNLRREYLADIPVTG